MRPACFFRDPKDVSGPVLVGVLRVRALRLLGQKLVVALLEGVGDVLQEDQTEHDVLVLGGVHVVPQLIGGGPERGLEPEVRAIAVALGGGFLSTWHIGVNMVAEITDET